MVPSRDKKVVGVFVAPSAPQLRWDAHGAGWVYIPADSQLHAHKMLHLTTSEF
jgi:hypothetical protein